MARRNGLFLLLILALLLPAACAPGKDGYIHITSPLAGRQISVNVIKVEGYVTAGAESVTVNGKVAHLAAGRFMAYAELTEETFFIDAAAVINGETFTDRIGIFFSPPLTIYLNGAGFQPGVDHRTTPNKVTGWVTNPDATVTVNGKVATVEPDGDWAVDVQLQVGGNRLEAIASLNGVVDSMVLFNSMDENGRPGITPGGGGILRYVEQHRIPDTSIVERGHDAIFEWIIESGKTVLTRNHQVYHFSVPEKYQDPDGLNVQFIPDTFTVYPNTTYELSFVVTASPKLKPGTYLVVVEMSRLNLEPLPLEFKIEVR